MTKVPSRILNPLAFPPQHAVDLVVAVVSSATIKPLVSLCFSNNTEPFFFFDKSLNIFVTLCILFVFLLHVLTSSCLLSVATSWQLRTANFPVAGQRQLILSSKLNVRTDGRTNGPLLAWLQLLPWDWTLPEELSDGVNHITEALTPPSPTRLGNFRFQPRRVKQLKEVNDND